MLNRSEGGIGVRGLSILNRVLLCKRSWRFAEETCTLLCKIVISMKYGVKEGVWFTRDVREGYGVRLWKGIRKGAVLLNNNCVFVMGEYVGEVWDLSCERRGGGGW